MNSELQNLLEKALEQYHGAARFKWLALTTAWVVCLVGWMVILFQPDMYAAQARIYVDTRTALAPVLQGLAINQDVNAQLDLVRQSLLGRPELELIAREADLDLKVNTPEERASMLDGIAKNVGLDGRNGGGGTVYTIRYLSKSRETSLKVVEVLQNTFVEQVLGGKRTGMETAQTFLRKQIEDYEQRLRDSEQRLAEFKRRNVGQMPGAQGDYFSRLQGEMQQIQKVRGELSIAITRRDELMRQLRGDRSGSPASTVVQLDPTGETAIRIREAQARLAELTLRFTDIHPDVVAARETLQQLEDRKRVELAALSQMGRSGVQASENPVMQKMQQDFNSSEVEVAALRSELGEHERRVAELRQLVNVVPEVEAEFARLNRDYEVTRTQYTALIDRLDKANLGEQAESTESVRFDIIDPPAAGFTPVAPNRPMLATIVLLLGLGAGGGLAYMLHMLRPVFHSSNSLNEITGLPVLGVVSMTWLERFRHQQHRIYLRFAAGIGGLLLVFVASLQTQELGVRLVRQLFG